MIGDILQPTHLLFILAIALLVLGPKRLPEVGRALGRGLRDFRNALNTDELRDHMVSSTSMNTTAPTAQQPFTYPETPVAPDPAPVAAEPQQAPGASTADQDSESSHLWAPESEASHLWAPEPQAPDPWPAESHASVPSASEAQTVVLSTPQSQTSDPLTVESATSEQPAPRPAAPAPTAEHTD